MLNFKNFQKIAEDDKTVTMRHDKGHEMKILLKQLRPIEREQIKRIKLAKGGEVQKFSDGTPDDTVKQDAPADQAAAPDKSITINVGQPAAAQTPVSQAQPLQAPAAQFAQVPVNVKAPAVPQAQPNLNPEGTMNPGAVAQNAQAGAGLQRDVNVAQAKGMAQIEDEYNTEKAKIAQTDADNFQKYVLTPTANFKQYVESNPINPKAYVENMNAGKKVTTAIGLLLGGMGGKGQGNVAMDFLNKQIDRDIEGQKARIGQQQTILGSYQHAYGDSSLANNLAKASMIDIYDHKAKQLAASLGTPQAWANYQQFSAGLALEKSKALQDSAVDLKALPGTSQGGPMGGQPRAGAPTASLAPVSGEKPSDRILNPNAEQHFKQLAYTPKAKDSYGAIQSQYNNAVQADKALAQIDDTFSNLQKNVEAGSVGGNLRRRGGHAVAGLPLGIGQAISGSLNYLTDTDANKAYDSNQSNLLGYISSALKGTNVGGGQIEDIVEKNSPERGDSPELVAQKKQTIKDFIKNHTDTSLLKAWNLTN